MAYRQVNISQGRRGFQPQCSHITMTRLYGVDFVYEACNRPGPFGWVYRCTQDREELIEQAASRGFSTAFDNLGHRLSEELRVRKGSPAARQDRLSLFDEITCRQLAAYRPDQVATILRQRENLQIEIEKEQIRKNTSLFPDPFHQTNSMDHTNQGYNCGNRWSCIDDEECQVKICPFCRPSYAERAFLSLTAVAVGELPPTVAIGFGFQALGKRPVVDASIVKNLGLRPPPPPRSDTSFTATTLTSGLSTLDLLDEQIAQSCGLWHEDHESREFEPEDFLSLMPSISGQLSRSPRCENLRAYGQDRPRQAEQELEQTTCTGEAAQRSHPTSGYNVNCVVLDHVGSVSTPEQESTDYLVKVSELRAQASQ